jgi:bifunctional non-homologous end joining protein LigD
VSRNGVEHTRRFGDVAAAVAKLTGQSLVLDGEVAIYDQQLRSRFDRLRDPDPDAVASPPLFMAFDLLYYDGLDLSALPLHDRRACLEDVLACRRARVEDIVAGSKLVFPVRRLGSDGLEAWRHVVARGYEGLVAKDERSPYQGGPTRRWLKVKQKNWTAEENRWRRLIFGEHRR